MTRLSTRGFIALWIIVVGLLCVNAAKASVGPGGICTGVKIQKLMHNYNRAHRARSYMWVNGSVYQVKVKLVISRFSDGVTLWSRSIPNGCPKSYNGASHPSWLPVSLWPYWP